MRVQCTASIQTLNIERTMLCNSMHYALVLLSFVCRKTVHSIFCKRWHKRTMKWTQLPFNATRWRNNDWEKLKVCELLLKPNNGKMWIRRNHFRLSLFWLCSNPNSFRMKYYGCDWNDRPIEPRMNKQISTVENY